MSNDYENYPFSEDELEVKDSYMFMGAEVPLFNTPITYEENILRTIENKPLWQPCENDYQYLYPLCVPDNPAKGNVSDAKLPPEKLGGFDMFGIEWEYEPNIGGSTVRPGNPLLDDANEWYEKVKFPTKEDIDSWDWEGSKKINEANLKDDLFWDVVICTGWFERLISFMDFEEAAVAMIDDDQQDAVKDLFDKLSDLYIMLIDKFMEVFPGKINAFTLHDDWGHQRGVFFSLDTVREMIVPYMKKVTDYIHSLGLVAEVHSCGKDDVLAEAYIEAGFELDECQPLWDWENSVPKYGDKLHLHVSVWNIPEPGASEEEYRKCARDFVDWELKLGYPLVISPYYFEQPVTREFWEEMYRYSRQEFPKVFGAK